MNPVTSSSVNAPAAGDAYIIPDKSGNEIVGGFNAHLTGRTESPQASGNPTVRSDAAGSETQTKKAGGGDAGQVVDSGCMASLLFAAQLPQAQSVQPAVDVHEAVGMAEALGEPPTGGEKPVEAPGGASNLVGLVPLVPQPPGQTDSNSLPKLGVPYQAAPSEMIAETALPMAPYAPKAAPAGIDGCRTSEKHTQCLWPSGSRGNSEAPAIPVASDLALPGSSSDEKTADQSGTIPGFASKEIERFSEPAKIAGIPPVAGSAMKPLGASVEQSTAADIIPRAGGTSVAMQHEPMSAAHPQSPKSTSFQAVSGVASPVAASPTADALQPESAGSRVQNREDNDARTETPVVFETPAVVPATRAAAVSTNATVAPAKTAATPEAAYIVNHTLEAAERMHSNGRNNVEIQVCLRDGQDLTIQLHMNAGELHPVFKTESAELRAALEQTWNQFTSASVDRGLRIAAPVFEGSQQGFGNSQQGRDHQPQRQQSPLPFADEYPRGRQSKPHVATAHFGSGVLGEPSAFAAFA